MNTPLESGRCPLYLTLLQKLIRLLLRFPPTAYWVWKRMPHIRSYFSQSVGQERFVTQFEGSINFWVSLSDHIESQIFWQGVQEGDRGEVKLLKSLLAPQSVFIDVGANIGAFSLMAARRLPQGKVHSFEPSPYHIKKLNSNLLLNRFNNIQIHPVALSSKLGPAKLYFPKSKGSLENTGMASQFEFDVMSYRIEDIECVRLDDYLESYNISKVNIIKIDVEGAELDVLIGARQTIYRNRPHVLMEVNSDHLHRAGRNFYEVIDFWNSANYKIYKIGHGAELTPIHVVSDFCFHQNIYCSPVELDSSARK